MASPQVRLSTLAEIKVLSFEARRNFSVTNGAPLSLDTETVEKLIAPFKTAISSDKKTLDPNQLSTLFFKTVGIARQLRIDEQYNTTNIYGIGSPTKPRIVPGNMSVSVTCERLQLDKRNLYDFMSTPEYFYSPKMQKETGILDAFYHTYMFVKNKEPLAGGKAQANSNYDIYALMPVSSTRTVTNGDVMISHNVQLTGFKINNGDSTLQTFLSDLADDITGVG